VRELSGEEIQAQARALYSYVQRGGCEALWLRSKHFTREDEAAVRQAYGRMHRIAS
jgi:hypothetical protein